MKKGTSQLKLITRSISVIGSISYIVRDRSRSLPQIILAQTKTMKVALKPNPITVVTKLVSIPIVSNPPLHKTNLQDQATNLRRS